MNSSRSTGAASAERTRFGRLVVSGLMSCTALSGCAWALSDNFQIGEQAHDAGTGGPSDRSSGGMGGSTPGSSTALELGGALNLGGTAAEGGAFDTAGAEAIGGASATGGAEATGGSSTFGTGGVAATGGATGGTSATEIAAWSGGVSAPGGRTATGGLAASGGTAAMGGYPFGGRSWGSTTAANQYSPSCAASVAKDEPCYGSSGAVCYKTCGPSGIGFKSETCQGGVYVEQSTCSFPTGVDYSCYDLPSSLPNACPYGMPQASQACQVPQCTVCFGGTLAVPTYRDSTGSQKNGYCVCTSTGTWTCASTSSWPCPGSGGCESSGRTY